VPELIAVTGATGEVGGRVARRLADRGVPQRLLVRDASRAPQLPAAEVRQFPGYHAGEEMRAALEGVHTLFLVPAAEAPDRVEQHYTPWTQRLRPTCGASSTPASSGRA
jgi:NAD(P)H dehydrogenase (quinone)